MSSITENIKQFETILCLRCKSFEMILCSSNLWCCYNCNFKINSSQTNLNNKKYISKEKLKKYILSQFDDNISYKIIISYLSIKGYNNNIINNDTLINNLYDDLKYNQNIKTNKLFNLSNIIFE